MNIKIQSFSSSAVSFLQERVLPSFTAQQKKILIIAAFAFACLAACYALRYYRLRNQAAPLHPELKKKEPLVSPTANKAKETVEADKLNGQHKITDAEGTVWEGNFKEGKLEGPGKRTDHEGCIDEGEFKNGLLEGIGERFLLPDTRIKGLFKGGALIEGESVAGNGTKVKGKFSNGLTDDEGIKTFLGGAVLKGKFKESYNIYGVMTYPNGRVIEGKFGYGQVLNGPGKITDPDGTVKEGEVKNNKLNGKGKMTLPEGKVLEGQFKDDLYIEK